MQSPVGHARGDFTSWVAFLVGLTMLGGAGRAQTDGKAGRVRTEMKGIDFRIDPEVVLEIRWLRGSLIPTHEGQAPWFDDPHSFVLEIDAGEIAVTPASMGALLDHYVFTGPDAPVKDVEIQIAGNDLIQAATLRKKIPVRATIEGRCRRLRKGTSACIRSRSRRASCRSKGFSTFSASSCPR